MKRYIGSCSFLTHTTGVTLQNYIGYTVKILHKIGGNKAGTNLRSNIIQIFYSVVLLKYKKTKGVLRYAQSYSIFLINPLASNGTFLDH